MPARSRERPGGFFVGGEADLGNGTEGGSRLADATEERGRHSFPRMISSVLTRALRYAVLMAVAAAPASAHAQTSQRTEQVVYRNAQDGARLSATLAIPAGDGPHPGVVLLSVAGTDRLVNRLVGDGYAVLTPVRRGFVDVEPLLHATFADLAGDAQAAIDYLGARDEIDGASLALVAQADDTPPAMLAVASADRPVPLVLLAPPSLPGAEAFRLEQRWLAERARASAAELEALDAYVGRIAAIVLGEDALHVKRYRLEALRAGSRVQLPRNAALPADERQMDFFASPLWHDRLAFEPEPTLARLRSPVLLLIGAEDVNTPMDAYLTAVRRGLADAGNRDATVCSIPGRTRHSFTAESVAAIAEWLPARIFAPEGAETPGVGAPSVCMEDSRGG